jgi:diketogulonate reductase-like aldo/keto reductase
MEGLGQPAKTLPAGTRMPVLGLGVWQLAAGSATEHAVEWAIEAGYRHFDTATMYRNEQSLGAALTKSGLPREELFVTTKLYPTRPNASPELAKSLERLGFECVDLYLIHWPAPMLNVRHWRQLEELQARGLAREIGVSNFSISQLEALRRRGMTIPAVNQVHFSPFHRSFELRDYCARHGIVLEAYSPLERGTRMGDPTIAGIASRVGRTPAQVMLRWAIQHDAVVIPKSGNRDRIRTNAEVFDFALDDDAMRTIDGLA